MVLQELLEYCNLSFLSKNLKSCTHFCENRANYLKQIIPASVTFSAHKLSELCGNLYEFLQSLAEH